MNSSQLAGVALLVGVFAYPALVELFAALRRWKERRRSKGLFDPY